MMPTNAGCVLPAVLLAIVVALAGVLGLGLFTIVEEESMTVPDMEGVPPVQEVTSVPITVAPPVTPTPTITPTSIPSITPTPLPTLTPVTGTPNWPPSATPTAVTVDEDAAESPVTITNVFSPGSLAAEAVEISNLGPAVDLGGWQLVAPDGSTFTFPRSAIVFAGGAVRVYTRGGVSTAIAYYWNSAEPLWESGATVYLLDAASVVVSSHTVMLLANLRRIDFREKWGILKPSRARQSGESKCHYQGEELRLYRKKLQKLPTLLFPRVIAT